MGLVSLEERGPGLFWLDDKPDKGRKKVPKLKVKGGEKKTRARNVMVGPPPESSWGAPTEFPRISGTISVDLETRDEGLQKKMGPGWPFPNWGEIIGVGVAWGENKHGYWPINHPDSQNFPLEQILSFVGDAIGVADLTAFHNRLYDEGWLRKVGCKIRQGARLVDTGTAAALLNEHRYKYSLDILAKEYLGEGKDETLLKAAMEHFGLKSKDDLYLLPARYVGPYGSNDAAQTKALWAYLWPKIQEEGLEKIFELETELTPCLMEMRRQGIRVDEQRAHELDKELTAREEAVQLQLDKMAGRQVEIWSDSLAWCFDHLNLTYPRGEAGDPSFTGDWLEAHDHEFPRLVAGARKWNRARGTLRGHIIGHAVNGRLHCQFNPLKSDDGGTVSARFSSSNPNLQQLPSEDEELKELIRGLLLPEEGELWCASDYSQQEPRITVHYAALTKCTGAELAVEAYKNDPSMSYHKWVGQVCSIPYPKAKKINLAMTYGKGEVALCRDLGLATIKVGDREFAGEDGKALFNMYHSKLPYIRELVDKLKKKVKRTGYLTTLGGRRCRFPIMPNGKQMSTHKALNRLIQSSAADMIKVAMRDLWRQGIVPKVTVHDELGISVKDAQQAIFIANIMAAALPISVPNKVDIEIGPNWGAAKLLDEA